MVMKKKSETKFDALMLIQKNRYICHYPQSVKK
jgi:hypothetical protein